MVHGVAPQGARGLHFLTILTVHRSGRESTIGYVFLSAEVSMCSIGNDPHDEHREYLNYSLSRRDLLRNGDRRRRCRAPLWSLEGSELYYEANGKLYAAKVQNGQQMFGEPRELLPISRFVPTRLRRTWI